MWKHRMVAVFVAIVLTLGATGAAGIVADSLELSMTSPAYACESSSGSGGC